MSMMIPCNSALAVLYGLYFQIMVQVVNGVEAAAGYSWEDPTFQLVHRLQETVQQRLVASENDLRWQGGRTLRSLNSTNETTLAPTPSPPPTWQCVPSQVDLDGGDYICYSETEPGQNIDLPNAQAFLFCPTDLSGDTQPTTDATLGGNCLSFCTLYSYDKGESCKTCGLQANGDIYYDCGNLYNNTVEEQVSQGSCVAKKSASACANEYVHWDCLRRVGLGYLCTTFPTGSQGNQFWLGSSADHAAYPEAVLSLNCAKLAWD